MSVHDLGLDLPESDYENQRTGDLVGYTTRGAEDPDCYYFHRTMIGAFTALDYLSSHPSISPDRIGITGSSQGAGLSLLVAGLDSRVKALAVNVPTMCDHMGYTKGRPSGWPHFWRHFVPTHVHRTMACYDAAIAAQGICAPAFFSVGFLDQTCPPTTVYAAYNSLKGCKSIQNHTKMAHAFPEAWYDDSAL